MRAAIAISSNSVMYAPWRSVETYIVKVAQDRTIPRADLVELVAQRGQGPAFDILLRQQCRLLAG